MMSSKKSKSKTFQKPLDGSANAEIKGMISYWWNLSVFERNKHFHAMKVFLLTPIMFASAVEKRLPCEWAPQDFSAYENKGLSLEMSADDYRNIDVIEKAMSILQDCLAKFDENNWLLENLLRSIKEIEVLMAKGSLPSLVNDPRKERWIKHLKKNMPKTGKDINEVDAVLVVAAKQVCSYLKGLSAGYDHLELFTRMSSLTENEGKKEKLKGNRLFADECYDQAIKVYTAILEETPFNHILYCNRAKCFLIKNKHRLALADARRTIVLDSSYDKGHYRYAESLENLNRIDDAISALKNAVTLCQPKDAVEKYLSKLTVHADQKRHEIKLKKALPTYPPDLVVACSGDESGSEAPPDPVMNACNYCNHYRAVESLFKTHSSRGCEECGFSSEYHTDSDDEDDTCSDSTNSSGLSKSPAKDSKMSVNKPMNSPLLNLYAEMKKGTEFFLAKKYLLAKNSYHQVLGIIADKRELSLPEDDEAILIYASGMSCYEIGKPKDLKQATNKFNRITRGFKDVYFPLAYYGCGKVLQRQSKFFEMRLMLTKTLEVLDKTGLVLSKWPGSDVTIDETRPGKLKEKVTDLLGTLEISIAPDAICKYQTCSHKKRYISFSDPDFKGFVRLICSESCKIDYHSLCWKKFKSEFTTAKCEKFSEKEFMNHSCFTPDCSGAIYHILMHTHPNGKIDKEFKTEIKKCNSRRNSLDKSSKPKPSSQKKKQKKQRSQEEKEKCTEEQMKEANDDIERILNELDAEDAIKIQRKRSNPFISKENLPARFADFKKPPVPPEPAPVNDHGMYILNTGENTTPSQPPAISKRKDTRKKKKNMKEYAPNGLTGFLGADSKPYLRDPPPEERLPIRSASGPMSLSTAFEADPFVPYSQNDNIPDEDSGPDSVQANVKRHLYTIFEDLLIGKGSMNITNDQDLLDLIDILDAFSVELINKSGGLRKFISMSSKFVFDPENTDVVFPAAEADIFFMSRKEARNHEIQESKRQIDEHLKYAVRRSSRSNDELCLFDGSEKDMKYQRNGNREYFDGRESEEHPNHNHSNDVIVDDLDFEEAFEKLDANRNESQRTSHKVQENNSAALDMDFKENANLGNLGNQPLGNLGNFNPIFNLPSQRMMTRPVINPYLKLQMNHQPAIRPLLPQFDARQVASDSKGRHTNEVKNANEAKTSSDENEAKTGNGMKNWNQAKTNTDAKYSTKNKFSNDTEHIAKLVDGSSVSGGKIKTSNELTSQDTTKREDATLPSNSKNRIDEKDLKETVDIGTLTDDYESVYKKQLEKEVAEKRQLTEKYADVLDSFEQLKKRIKLVKDTLARTEEDTKSKIETLQDKLSKEKQSRDKEQKKWNQERENMKEKINILEQRISKSEEAKYKRLLAEKEAEFEELFEKVGKFQQARAQEKLDYEDIVKKLGTCVTDQSKRAQKAEVVCMEMKIADVCSGYQRMLFDARNVMHSIDSNPFLDGNVNRKEMHTIWESYMKVIENNLQKCRLDLEERLRRVKGGIPLEDIPPFVMPQNPPPPLLPKMVPFPPNMMKPSLMQMPNGATPRFPMPMPTPIDFMQIPKPEDFDKKNLEQNGVTSKANTAPVVNGATACNYGPAATPQLTGAANAEPNMLLSGPTRPLASTVNQATSLVKPHAASNKFSDAKKSQAEPNKAQANSMDGKSSAKGKSCEKILDKLGPKFPNYSREELIMLLKDFREKRNNTLSGLTVDGIIESISKIIISKESKERQKAENSRKPPGLESKYFGFEEPCIICHEDMIDKPTTTKLQCGHVFHADCIRRWLKEQRTCPTCRKHALLQEDFPALH